MTFDTSWCFTRHNHFRSPLRHCRPQEFYDPYDALRAATGATLRRMRVSPSGDSALLDSRDATDMLHAFARACALSVSHLWDAPEIACEWMVSGDASSRPSFISNLEVRDGGASATGFAFDAALWAVWGRNGANCNTEAWRAADKASISALAAAKDSPGCLAPSADDLRDRFNAMAADLFIDAKGGRS